MIVEIARDFRRLRAGRVLFRFRSPKADAIGARLRFLQRTLLRLAKGLETDDVAHNNLLTSAIVAPVLDDDAAIAISIVPLAGRPCEFLQDLNGLRVRA